MLVEIATDTIYRDEVHHDGFYAILYMISNQQIPGASKAFIVN